MRWSWGPTRLAFALLIAVVVSRSARASCVTQVTFGQLSQSCGSSYCYVVTPGAGSPQSMDGAFWAFGYGSSINGTGVDDGTSTLDSWLPVDSGGRYLMGDWTAPGVDGCIAGSVAPGKFSEIMVADIED